MPKLQVERSEPASVRTRPRARGTSKGDQYAATRADLLAAAARLFAERGFVGTGTEDIVAAANITRGALYYHFKDKRDIFAAVVEDVSRQIHDSIQQRAKPDATASERLIDGCIAFITACLDPAVARIYLVDGPSVLGWSEWRSVDAAHAASTLEARIAEAVDADKAAVTFLATAISGLLNEVASLAASPDPAVSPARIQSETRAAIRGLLSAYPPRPHAKAGSTPTRRRQKTGERSS